MDCNNSKSFCYDGSGFDSIGAIAQDSDSARRYGIRVADYHLVQSTPRANPQTRLLHKVDRPSP